MDSSDRRKEAREEDRTEGREDKRKEKRKEKTKMKQKEKPRANLSFCPREDLGRHRAQRLIQTEAGGTGTRSQGGTAALKETRRMNVSRLAVKPPG